MSVAKKAKRKQIHNRDRYTCSICSYQHNQNSNYNGGLSIDHIIPREANGSNDVSNLRTACFNCNSIRTIDIDEVAGWPRENIIAYYGKLEYKISVMNKVRQRSAGIKRLAHLIDMRGKIADLLLIKSGWFC